jgi:hypothetical protein
MAKLKDAKRMCPELVVIHVATYKEGEKEPGYWENVDTRTHKVRRFGSLYLTSHADFILGQLTSVPHMYAVTIFGQ